MKTNSKHKQSELNLSLPIPEDQLSFLQDPIFISPIRLTIIMILNANPSAGFTRIRKLVKITPGNMDHHAKTLVDAGYIIRFSTFKLARPLIQLKITGKGKQAYLTYTEHLMRFIQYPDKIHDEKTP